MVEGSRQPQVSSYKINESRGCSVQHSDSSSRYCIVCLNVAKRLILKVLTRKKNVTICDDGC